MLKSTSKTSKTFKLNIAEFSDVHLGHPHTPTTHILQNLSKAFPDNPKTGELDIIFIAGDFFDRLLTLGDPNVHEIKYWISSFLRMCKERDIVLRVLEGTPSHDWKQSLSFVTLNEAGRIGCDVKYINTLSIEYVERFGIHVLYVPDEWRVRCEDTWVEVTQLLAANNLTQVDFAIMHGAFPHQMPKNVHHLLEMHDPAKYLSIVKYYIFVGHIHFQSQYERILSAGSFDRIAHGEERTKGHYRVYVEEGQETIIEFIVNKGAKQYVTIDCVGVSPDDIIKHVNDRLMGIPIDSNIRLRARKGEAGISSKEQIQQMFSQYYFTVLEDGKGTADYTPLLVDTRKLHKTINITASNISDLLKARIVGKYPQIHWNNFKTAIDEVINA